MTRLFILLFLGITSLCFSAQAQQKIRLMSYNILRYPSVEPPNRIDTLEKIIDYYRPQLLMLQELRTSSALSDIADMMDDLDYGSFAPCQFVPTQSNTFDDIQQAIVYDRNVFRLKSQDEIITDVRDINEYVMYLNDAALEDGADTVFLYVYVAHLKSSTGEENETDRLNMVNAWKDHVEAHVPAGSRVIIAGDFNLYTRTEPAYQALIANDSPMPMKDVFSSFGEWTGTSFSHKEILTQSTRVSQIFGDGAGGGVDDRFDFILFSNPLLNEDGDLYYVDESYQSLGNNGTCYNQNITACNSGNPVPIEIRRAIYYMSDHIPQVCELETPISLSIAEKTVANDFGISAHRTHEGNLRIRVRGSAHEPVQFTLTDLSGRTVDQWISDIGDDSDVIERPASTTSGIFLLRAANKSGHSAVIRLALL